MRYVPDRDKWRVWRDGHWRDDVIGDRWSIAIAVARATHLEAEAFFAGENADDGKHHTATPRDKAHAWAHRSESRAALSAALALASTLPPIAAPAATWDAEPRWLGVPGGVVDLATGRRRPAYPTDLISRVTRADPDLATPAATLEWSEYLRWASGTDPVTGSADASWMDWIQVALGMSVAGRSANSADLFVFCHGGGANGKSTVLGAAAHALGAYARIVPGTLIVETTGERHPTELTTLEGVRLAVIDETERNKRLDESKLKMLTGGLPISARGMGQNFYEFDPTHTLWISGQHRPRITGTDAGIWRRVQLLPWDAQLPPGECDPGRRAEVRDTLQHAVLAWLIDGARWWYDTHELPWCPRVTAATQSYRQDEDMLAEFWDDRCDLSSPTARTTKSALRDSLRAWCLDHDLHPLSDRAVHAEMDRHGVTEYRSVVGDTRERGWLGLRLLPAPAPASRTEWHRAYDR